MEMARNPSCCWANNNISTMNTTSLWILASRLTIPVDLNTRAGSSSRQMGGRLVVPEVQEKGFKQKSSFSVRPVSCAQIEMC